MLDGVDHYTKKTVVPPTPGVSSMLLGTTIPREAWRQPREWGLDSYAGDLCSLLFEFEFSDLVGPGAVVVFQLDGDNLIPRAMAAGDSAFQHAVTVPCVQADLPLVLLATASDGAPGFGFWVRAGSAAAVSTGPGEGELSTDAVVAPALPLPASRIADYWTGDPRNTGFNVTDDRPSADTPLGLASGPGRLLVSTSMEVERPGLVFVRASAGGGLYGVGSWTATFGTDISGPQSTEGMEAQTVSTGCAAIWDAVAPYARKASLTVEYQTLAVDAAAMASLVMVPLDLAALGLTMDTASRHEQGNESFEPACPA